MNRDGFCLHTTVTHHQPALSDDYHSSLARNAHAKRRLDADTPTTKDTDPHAEARVLTHATRLAKLRPYYTEDNRDLFRVLLNATSAAEANLALQVLTPLVPERTLVTACNLREVLRAMPESPFTMRVDEETLVRAAGLKKQLAAYSKVLPDGLELAVTTAGNLVLDVIIKDGDTKYSGLRCPCSTTSSTPRSSTLLVESDTLLDAVFDLVKYMGVSRESQVLSLLDDFTLEYASDTLAGLGDLF